MGEPGDDARWAERQNSAIQELPDGDGAIFQARRDIAVFQALVVRHLQQVLEHLEGASHIPALVEAVNNNTRAMVALVKALQPKSPDAPGSAATTEQAGQDAPKQARAA